MTKAHRVGPRSNRQRLVRPFLVALASVAAFFPTPLPAATGSKPAIKRTTKPKVMPTFEAVKAAVAGQLKTKNRYYKPGDILSRGDVDAIFDKLSGLGWKVEDSKAILEQLLPDDYYLIRALRSRGNGQFMRQVSQVPNGYAYDRLDRISRMADGQVLISRIMQEPGGWQFVDIMSESKEAPGMARAFSMGAGGKDFTKPTGRIYTEQQLIERLKQSYDKAIKKKPSTTKPSANEPIAKKPPAKKP